MKFISSAILGFINIIILLSSVFFFLFQFTSIHFDAGLKCQKSEAQHLAENCYELQPDFVK
uniref:Uncharacterized protein n=1 Tax=Octopus bimaculoides TaxID=37653 RepID=A0A0L8G644_OCTBM